MQRIAEQERQAQARQQALDNQLRAQQEARAQAAEGRTAQMHPLEMMKAEAALRPPPEPMNVFTGVGPQGEPMRQAVPMSQLMGGGVPEYRAPATPTKTPEAIFAEAKARAAGARAGAPPIRRASIGPQLGMSNEHFKWIQTLPQTDNDVQVATQKALKFIPGNPQSIVQAVREAYGMTRRPSASEIGRVPADVRLRLQTELANWDIEGADLNDEEFATGRQRIVEEILDNAGLPR